MSEVRTQLRNQPLTDLTASSLNTVGGRVFPDGAAIGDLGALLQIAEAWRSVHAPTYGAPIAGTGALATHAMVGSDVENVLDISEGVAKVQALTLTNGGPGPIDWSVFIGGVALSAIGTLNAPPGGYSVFTVPTGLVVDSGTPLQVQVTGGTPTDATVDVSFIRVAF